MKLRLFLRLAALVVRMANDTGNDLLYLIPRYVHILNDRTMSAFDQAVLILEEDFLLAFDGGHR